MGSSCHSGQCQSDVFCGNMKCDPGENCSNCPGDCACMNGQKCTAAGSCCSPQCSGKECGDDGCGGTCGACGSGFLCESGRCMANAGCGDHACDPVASENCRVSPYGASFGL